MACSEEDGSCTLRNTIPETLVVDQLNGYMTRAAVLNN
jgi:hypothetical protein